jgi:hypothetical protein
METVNWQDLNVMNALGVDCGKLGEMIGVRNLDQIVLDEHGAVVDFPAGSIERNADDEFEDGMDFSFAKSHLRPDGTFHNLLFADGETPGIDTPRVPVNWSGLREALGR